MKNLQSNLFVVLGICLCGLCAYQWHGQMLQRNALEKLNQVAYDKSIAIRDYTNSIATLNHQVSEMDASLTELRNEARTNTDTITAQKHEVERLQVLNEGLTNEISQYQEAVGTLTNRLAEAYTGIDKQNAALKDLAAQRDEFIQKYNDEVKDRNNIVSNYNALAAQVKKLQGGSQ